MSVGVAAVAAWRRSVDGLRDAITTPVALRVAAVVLTAGIAVVGIVAVQTTLHRQAAADELVLDAAPRVVAAEELYAALAEAHAAATTTFLELGLEDTRRLRQYRRDMALAGERLADLASGTDADDGVSAPLSTLTGGLQRYAGLIELARANNRLGHNVGAAYLGDASDVMGDELLPAALDVYRDAIRRIEDTYGDGESTAGVAAVVVGAAVVLVVLVATQALLAVRTRRTLNAGLLASAVILVVLAAWTVVSLAVQGRAVAASRREGAAPVAVLSQARILTLRSLSDENLFLIGRRTVEAHRESFDAAVAALGDPDGSTGLMARIDDAAGEDRAAIGAERIADRYAAYRAVHDEVRDSAEYLPAVDIAVHELALKAEELDGAILGDIERATRRLAARAEDARDLTASIVVLVVLTVAAGAAVVAGLRPRLREYR